MPTPTSIVLGPFTCLRLGDVLCTSPLPRALHHACGTRTFVAENWLSRQIFVGNPYVTGFVNESGIAPEMQATGAGHVIQQLLQGFGLPIDPIPRPEIFLDDDEREWASFQQNQLPRGKRMCVVSSGAISDRQNLEQVDWEKVVRVLSQEYTVIQARQRESMIPGAAILSDLPLRRYMALLSIADLFVGGTSGGSHVAAAFNVPSLIVIWRSLHAQLKFPVAGQGVKAAFLYPQHWFVAAESISRQEFNESQLTDLIGQVATAGPNGRPTSIGNHSQSPCGFRPSPRRAIQSEGRRLLCVPRAYGYS